MVDNVARRRSTLPVEATPMRSGLLRLIVLSMLLLSVVPARAQARSEEALTDGGGTPDVLESIFIPALANAPFSLQLNTEWTRPMNGGGTYTVVNTRPIKRDSAGRIYQERWTLIPKGNNEIKSVMTTIQIGDPPNGIWLQCNVFRRVCELQTWRVPALIRYQEPGTGTTPLSNGRGAHSHEDLGAAEVLGLPAHLYRDVVTYNPGVLGNDQLMSITREFSYSAALGINLRSIVDAPMIGRQQFNAAEITTTEPEAKWFKAPDGYQVIDRRKPQPPGQQ